MTIHFPNVLIVDDDPIILRTLSLNLQADGYEVMTASSGAEAFRALEQRLPDLAIVSIHPPNPCRVKTTGTTVVFTPIIPPGPPG